MNPLIQRTTILPLLVAITLACFGLLPQTQAVSPTPDGCYPNFTTAEGCDALNFLTTGSGNTGLGWRSLFLDSTGSFNTGVGGGALALNTADSNTAVGAAALLLNTTGTQNIAVGTDALVHNDSASFNNAVGAFALFNNLDGPDNNAFGNSALSANIHASDNTAIGDLALANNDNTGAGVASGNTAVGSSALISNSDGASNTAVGLHALFSNDTGDENTANGAFSLFNNATGTANTAVGLNALFNNSTNSENTAIGAGALFSTTSDANTGVGFAALSHDTTGTFNTALGNGAGSNVETANNVICIGSLGGNVSNSCFIANIRGKTTVNNDAIPVLIDSAGQLGTMSSSRRFKTDINPIDKASESLLALKPVSFRYKVHKDTTPQFGLIAEDVAKVNPNLVIYDPDGKPFTVRYDAVNAMLLNEFLKEHRKVEQLQATVAQQQKDLQAAIAKLKEAVTAQLNEQAAQIQQVSARLELSRRAPQTVLNKQ
jgi:trimeric autotransporter adhesin